MSVWNILDGGMSMPEALTLGQRLNLRIGRYFALRHRGVTLAQTCRVHAGAKINPRQGRIQVGELTTIAEGAVIQGNVFLGHHCSVQIYSLLIGYGTADKADGRISIGNYVRIAPRVMMIGANHIYADTSVPIHSQGLRHEPIVVEDDVWIGGGVIVVAGVTVGRGSVIGAGSVVTKNIPPLAVAVGTPARVIKTRVTPGPEPGLV